MEQLDVVIVAYNNRDQLRAAVDPLARIDGVRVIVVDNDSADRCLETISDLRVLSIPNPTNVGFARACNTGWRAGSAPYVMFLNPDAQIDAASLERLIETATDPGVGVVAPRTTNSERTLVYSQRRFVGAAALLAQAFFVHRLISNASWVDGIVRGEAVYQSAGSPDWVSGACMLIRRSMLESTGGFDERFFMYCEDMDLCRRIRDLGLDVRYEPAAVVRHDEGSSAPRSAMVPVLVRSRIRYVEKHFTGWRRTVARLGIALHEASRVVVSKGGVAIRMGHLRGLRVAVFPGER